MIRPALPYTPDRFEAWLRTMHAPHDLVGWRGKAHQCPLAHYLKAHGADDPLVWPTVYIHRTTALRPNPLWACTFLDILDMQGATGSSVTVEEALHILATMTPSVQEVTHEPSCITTDARPL
jgi:hypothetical protein